MSKLLLPLALSIAIASILFLPSCAHNPTLGEQLVTRGEKDVDLGKQWIEGQDLIKDGNEDIEKGTQRVKDGRKKLQHGKQLVEEVERMRAPTPSGS